MQFIEKIFPKIPIENFKKEPLFSISRILYFLLALAQFIGLLFIIQKLNIEKASGISEISLFIILSFIITSFTPVRFRPFIFFVTSLSIIYFAFGPYSGTLLIAGALTLIAICHLQIKLIFKSLIILFAFAGMAILRADLVYAPRYAIIMPFLASMFMFRIILYLFDQKHNSIQATLWQRLNYLFLFPNTCFLFFPIIDYKSYIKTYYNVADKEVWQKGIRWMLRGIIHFIGYRTIYYYGCISPYEVIDLTSLLQFIISSYALILRLSGLFHFIMGLLCMFGFNLHPAFNNYFLATSFVDLWKRINIYWREFMLKIFFYSLLFKIKKKSTKYTIPLTTICVFIITWLLHNYQLFWLRGYFQLTFTDTIFWLVLGGCVTINVIINERSLTKISKVNNIYLCYFYSVLKMVGMLLFMSIMWAFWTSNSVPEWIFLVSKGLRVTLIEIIKLSFIFIGILAIGIVLQAILAKEKVKQLINIEPHQTLFLTIPSILLLLFCSFRMSSKILPIKVQSIFNTLSDDKFNEVDKKNVEVGYYKKVLDGEDDAPAGLWEIKLMPQKKHSAVDNILIRTNTLISRMLKPNMSVKIDNYSIETNSFGMRDKEYSITKDTNTFRIALLGGSYEMGAGVSNNEVFEGLIENKLNNHDTNDVYKKYEILNFAVYGYHLIQHVELCNTKVFNFKPDLVIYVAHSEEEKRFLNFFISLIKNGVNFKYPFLEDIKRTSGVKQSMSELEIAERLKPYTYSIIMWSYMQIEDICYKNHAKAIWAYLPCTNDKIDNNEYNKLQRFASLTGFITIDLRGVYNDFKVEDIQISKTNAHPNPKGHELIALRFYKELIQNKKQIFESKR